MISIKKITYALVLQIGLCGLSAGAMAEDNLALEHLDVMLQTQYKNAQNYCKKQALESDKCLRKLDAAQMAWTTYRNLYLVSRGFEESGLWNTEEVEDFKVRSTAFQTKALVAANDREDLDVELFIVNKDVVKTDIPQTLSTCLSKAERNMEVSACYEEAYTAADKLLNAKYKFAKEMCKASTDTATECLNNLKQAELSWIKYRDRMGEYMAIRDADAGMGAERNGSRFILDVTLFQVEALSR